MKDLQLRRRHWLAVLLVILSAPVYAELNLATAVERSLANNPSLALFPLRMQGIEGQQESAKLAPAYSLSLEAENIAGSGSLSGTDSAEYTLSIGSVLELGDKRSARTRLANSRYALAAAQREAAAIDLVADVTRRFIAVIALQEQSALAEQAHALARNRYNTVAERNKRGAAPEADRLRAKAELAQAALRRDNLSAELDAAKLALVTRWGEKQARFGRATGDLFALAEAADFNALYGHAIASPALAVLAAEQRIAEADLALIRSQSTSDVAWQLGVRRDQASGDSAFTLGVSVPLFGDRRNRGALKSAYAETEKQAYVRADTELRLRARLFTAWQNYQRSKASVEALRSSILPALEAAEAATKRAYEQGRYRYSDWAKAQQDLLDGRRNLISAAATALNNQALIEQLTASPLRAEVNHAH